MAEIVYDEIADNQAYRIISCGENTVAFQNESYQEDYIDQLYWEFDINGTPQRFEQWSPTVTFPAAGVYSGLLVLNDSMSD